MIVALTTTEGFVGRKKPTAGAAKRSPDNPIEVLREFLASLKAISETASLDPETARLVAVLEGVDALTDALRSDDVSTAGLGLRQEVKKLLDSLVDEIPRRLAGALPGGVEVQGVKPDYILDGSLHVHLDEARYSMTFAGTRLPIAPWKPIERSIVTSLTDLKNLEFAPDQFLSTLLGTYRHLIQEMGKPVGTVVPVERVIESLAVARQSPNWRLDPSSKNYRSYGRDHFRAQLYRLLITTPRPSLQGLRLNLTAGSNTDRALFMFVPALGRCAYVGLVAWTNETGA